MARHPIGLPSRVVQSSRVGKCWNCGKAGHTAADCRGPRRESSGQNEATRGPKMVTSTETRENSNSSPSSSEDIENNDPLLYLLSAESDSEDPSAVKEVRIADQGS